MGRHNEAFNDALDIALEEILVDSQRLCKAQKMEVRSGLALSKEGDEGGRKSALLFFEPSDIPSALNKTTREKFKGPIGSVGIRPGPRPMILEIHPPTKGWSEGAWKGIRQGGSYGASFSFPVCRPIPECSNLDCVATGLVLCGGLMMTFSTVGAVTGGLVGAVLADSADEVELAEEQTTTLLLQAEVDDTIQDFIIHNARKHQRQHVFPISRERRDAYMAGSNLYFLPSGEVSTVLEFNVLKIGLKAPVDGINPDMQFFLLVQTKLLSGEDSISEEGKSGLTTDENVLDERSFEYVSFPQTFAEWKEHNANLLKQELELGMETIAQQIVRELLLGEKKDQTWTRGQDSGSGLGVRSRGQVSGSGLGVRSWGQVSILFT